MLALLADGYDGKACEGAEGKAALKAAVDAACVSEEPSSAPVPSPPIAFERGLGASGQQNKTEFCLVAGAVVVLVALMAARAMRTRH